MIQLTAQLKWRSEGTQQSEKTTPSLRAQLVELTVQLVATGAVPGCVPTQLDNRNHNVKLNVRC
jgi:hypothetical protein